MSQLRKQQEKREKIIKRLTKLAIVFVILGLLALGVIFLYNEFFAKKPPEKFIPESPTSFISIDFKRSPDQDEIIKKLGTKLGDENIFENTLKNIIFPNLNEDELNLAEEEKVKSWLGEKIGIGHIYVSPGVSLSVFILDLKNQDLAKRFLQRFSDNLKKRGNVVVSEAFRDSEITEIAGETQLAYAINSSYLLISSRSDGVKKMIDTRTGRFPSLADSRDYYLTKKRVKAKSALAFAYLDTLEFLKIIYQAANKGQKDQEIFNQFGALKGKNYLGLSIIPQENGIKISGFTKKEGKTEFKFKKTKPSFDQKIPENLIVSIEGKDLKPLFEGILIGQREGGAEEAAKRELFFRAFELQTGLNLEKDLFPIFGENYVFALLPLSEKIEAGLITEIKNQPDILKKLSQLEETTVSLLNKYVIKDETKNIKFSEHQLGTTKYRYLNLPDQYQIDISYAVLPDYLILTTSKETLESLLKTIANPPKEVLANNQSYQEALKQLTKKEPHQTVFIDGQNLFKFISRYIRFDYEKLDKKAKAIESLVIVHEEKSNGRYFESFLKIK